MKKKLFIVLLTILLSLMALSLLCAALGASKKHFSFAAVGFFMAAFMLWQYKNELVPLRPGGPRNLSKGFWHLIKKPRGYQIHCIFWGVLMLTIGIGNLTCGIVLLF